MWSWSCKYHNGAKGKVGVKVMVLSSADRSSVPGSRSEWLPTWDWRTHFSFVQYFEVFKSQWFSKEHRCQSRYFENDAFLSLLPFMRRMMIISWTLFLYLHYVHWREEIYPCTWAVTNSRTETVWDLENL